jgi:hypothetical protein
LSNYYLIFEINKYSDEEIKDIGNLISTVFLLDKKATPEIFVKRFKEWIKRILISKFPIKEKKKSEEMLNENLIIRKVAGDNIWYELKRF